MSRVVILGVSIITVIEESENKEYWKIEAIYLFLLILGYLFSGMQYLSVLAFSGDSNTVKLRKESKTLNFRIRLTLLHQSTN